MSRRDFLKKFGLAGAVGIVGATAVDRFLGEEAPGRAPPPERPPEDEPPAEPGEPEIPYADRYDRVVDAGNEGVDADGEDPVNWFFEEYASEDTLLAFPPGTYRLDQLAFPAVRQVAVVAAGQERPTFVPTSGDCMGGHPYVSFNGVENLLLDGVNFDFGDVDAGGALHAFVEGENAFRNVRIRGSCSNQLSLVRIDVRDADGQALVENVSAENTDRNESLTGIYVGKDHAGELTLRNCELTGFSDNGLYASAPGLEDGRDGSVHVEGGTFANNNIANVRLGSSGSTCDGVTVRVDRTPPGWGDLNARGIRLRGRQGQVVTDCEVTIGAEGADSFGAVVFHPANDGATIRDTTLRVDKDAIPAIRAFATAEETDAQPTFENLTITGDAARGVVASLEGRPGTVFRGCTVEQRGSDRAGIRLANSQGCEIADCRIETGTDPVVLERSTAEITNTTVATPDGERELTDGTYENEVLTV